MTDETIQISTGKSKVETKWGNSYIKWSEFSEKLRKPIVTKETVLEYKEAPKHEKDNIKDVGGFVGGVLKDGKRRKGFVESRSLVTLDADTPTDDFLESIEQKRVNELIIYSTHSHTSDKPRFRLIFPLSHSVTAEEYEPIARKLAEKFGMDNFDDTTYQAERLMFWPSVSLDGEYIFKHYTGECLNPDFLLKEYADWKDVSCWPKSSRETRNIRIQVKEQGDPHEKKGIIGAWCRTYSITQCIEEFLFDVYEPTEKDNRFTFKDGSTSGGLVIYEDKFAYSHHATDPVGQRLCNSFDLVRLHKFGKNDIDLKIDTPIHNYPSFIKMIDFAKSDKEITKLIIEDRLGEDDFDSWDVEDKEWLKELLIDKKGNIENTTKNIELILQNDPFLKNKVSKDVFYNRIVLKGDLPWRKKKLDEFWVDSDDAGLRIYLENNYSIIHRSKIEDVFTQEVVRNSFHPIRHYLSKLEWDGISRVETILVDYLGASDTEYVRMVSRKVMIAAVARVYRPGVKFDHMLVTTGPQGIGKTLLPSKLAGPWFSNSLEKLSGKEAYEALHGTWIMELGELTATKKADIDTMKHFISKQEDDYRAAYGKHKTNFKRQCIFWGTSNDSDFLRDKTGNRRFWPVDVGINEIKNPVWEMTEQTRNQIWAEAKFLFDEGRSLYLNKFQEELAKEQQDLHVEVSGLEGIIKEFLNVKITEDWYKKSRSDRREFIASQEEPNAEEGEVLREKICVTEIWMELLNGDLKNIPPAKAAEIRGILANMSGWERYKNNRGRMRFGDAYGTQTAYVRIQENNNVL